MAESRNKVKTVGAPLEEGKEQEILDSLTFEKYKEMLPGVKNNYEFVNNLQPADDMIYDLIKG